MPRSLTASLLAFALLLAGGTPLLAAQPDGDAYRAAAEAFGLTCDDLEGNVWYCSSDAGDRYIDTSLILDDETWFQLQAGRNLLDGAPFGPVEPDVMAYFDELVAIATDGDPGASAWLASLNDGTPHATERNFGSWLITWNSATVDLADTPVPNVTLDLWYDGTVAPSLAPAPTAIEPTGDDDLGAFLTGYGLACTDVAAASTCRMELDDGAVYEVTTTLDATGAVSELAAFVRSVGASMPSDAGGFLRGVAERSPATDATQLLAWFDAAIAGGEPAYHGGGVSATWAELAAGAGRQWTLVVARADDAVAEPDAQPAPAEPASPETPAIGARPFADTVPSLSEVNTDPIILAQSALLALLVVFLMPFPGQLFNSTLEAHEDEVRHWFRLDRLGAVAAGAGAFWTSWPGVIAFTLLATLLYGFLDPGFGLNGGSLATFAGMLLGIVLVTAAFAVPAIVAHWRVGDRPGIKVVPISLVIGIVCVLVSRLTGFQPGYLYGLLIGLVFARELSAADEGRATALGAVLMLAVALLSWAVLGALPDGDGFGVVVARTALAALMVAGLEGVVFGLLPMRFLPGEPLYRWNRVLWAALLGVGAFAFFHILINPSSGYLSETSRTPLFTVIALMVGFSLASIAFWAWFRLRRDAPTDEAVARHSG